MPSAPRQHSFDLGNQCNSPGKLPFAVKERRNHIPRSILKMLRNGQGDTLRSELLPLMFELQFQHSDQFGYILVSKVDQCVIILCLGAEPLASCLCIRDENQNLRRVSPRSRVVTQDVPLIPG